MIFLMFALYSALASAETLDQLAAMRTVIRAEIDGTSVCPKLMNALSPRAREALPMGLEAWIREELASMTKKERKRFFTTKRVGRCEEECRCGIYADWIGNSPEFAAKRKELRKKDKKRPLNRESVAACAKASQSWVCENPFFKKVVSEIDRDARGSTK